ncbi:MAG: phosphopantothenoylcysteine decarboxylase [Chloroflexi bacterium RBG_16_48_8]|nr:MAG: phosphopantothenoylcysteine decarboxylase [Chloroflexi bacterium RBG_16_48_8]
MNLIQQIPLLHERRILLGVSGSIAAYKAADLASKLTQAGALVDVILSDAAQEFVSPITFQSVTGRNVYTDVELWASEGHILHVGLAENAELFIIAPVTANTIGKLAHGLADSLLTLTALAVKCPLLLAPAMDAHMFENPAVQDNLALLRQRGVFVVEPAEGRMASGLVGKGRLVETWELIGHIRRQFGRRGPLAGLLFVVTAGGTQEPIDAVRAITNRSSGKQGFALAQAALDRGAEVVLIAGPSHLQTPIGAKRIDVRTAAEMRDAVLNEVDKADVLLMAAAVADFRATQTSPEKIKRSKGVPQIQLEPTDDILALVANNRRTKGWPRLMIGFAAESEDLITNARAKLLERDLALIVANDITAHDAGFDVETNQVTLIDAEGGVQELPLMTKVEVAESVFQRILRLLELSE